MLFAQISAITADTSRRTPRPSRCAAPEQPAALRERRSVEEPALAVLLVHGYPPSMKVRSQSEGRWSPLVCRGSLATEDPRLPRSRIRGPPVAEQTSVGGGPSVTVNTRVKEPEGLGLVGDTGPGLPRVAFSIDSEDDARSCADPLVLLALANVAGLIYGGFLPKGTAAAG